jgi:two-component system, sensor histidine kinase and response regulator
MPNHFPTLPHAPEKRGPQNGHRRRSGARPVADKQRDLAAEAEARFRGAFNASAIGMALVSLDGRFLQVNPALCTIVGYDEDELLLKTSQDITHPDDLEVDLDAIQQLLAGNIPSYQIEKRYLRKDEEIIWGRLTVSLVRDAAGFPLYFVAQLQDITPYKAIGAKLREAEARYRRLVEQIPAAVHVDAADALGSPVYISPRVESLLGYTPEEWLATPDMWLQLSHPDDRERIQAEITKASANKQSFQVEGRFVTRDGRVVWIRDQAALVRDEDGVGQYWQGFMVDITDRKLAETELQAAKEAAEEASRVKSVLLSMATHELRTPLTIISGYVELLTSSKTALSAEEREFLDVIQTSTETLTTLVNDLLDLARLEGQRLKLAIRPVDVGDLVEKVHRMVAAQAAVKGIGLPIEIAPDVPTVAADPDRLQQVFLNLVGNAVKFTPYGYVRSTVRAVDDGVEITVADTGIGIAPEALPRIFDVFEQADSGMARKFGGSGLGLAIAKRLVEMHAGRIAVESTAGVGSRFTVWLPEMCTDHDEEESWPSRQEARS